MAYDHFSVPKGYRTDLFLIIAPYFDVTFISRLVDTLRPRRVRALLDDGAKPEDCHAFREAAQVRDFRFAMGAAPGLVHIKLFYAEFVRSKGRKRRRRMLFFGSANATQAAFSGERNAELIAVCELRRDEDYQTIEYVNCAVEAIERGSGSVAAARGIELSRPAALSLPAIKVLAPGPSFAFDAWLQRGHLVARHREPQQFLKLSVKLKKRLRVEENAEGFAAGGWPVESEMSAVRRKYVGSQRVDEGDHEEDVKIRNWKTRYCTWTNLGEWVGGECFQRRSTQMVLNAARTRRADIEELATHGGDKTWRNARVKLMLEGLAKAWSKIEAPQDYLEGDASGLNRAHYGSLFDDRIKRDFAFASDPQFRRRYESGYELLDVPRFRQDTDAWDRFVASWCESIVLQMNGPTQSAIVQVLKAVVKKSDQVPLFMTSEQAGRWLRNNWNEKFVFRNTRQSLGEILADYDGVNDP